ncbi:sigma-70 family RNA polymerase sigma factor [bacterium]|nr:sigma-70 family RNA polymerase sigma factor [bacterium]
MDNDKLNLITLAINGSKDALKRLLKEEEKNIYCAFYYMNKDNFDINDLCQNVLLKISNKITTLKNPKSFKTWLNQIIIHTYYDYLRKYKIKTTNFETDPIDLEQNPENTMIRKELDRYVQVAIKNLPERYKIPITLREIEGMSYSQISKITNTGINTVKTRISRARDILKDKIKQFEKD